MDVGIRTRFPAHLQVDHGRCLLYGEVPDAQPKLGGKGGEAVECSAMGFVLRPSFLSVSKHDDRQRMFRIWSYIW